MKKLVQKIVSSMLVMCMVVGLCFSAFGLENVAEAAGFVYDEPAPVLKGVTLTKKNKTSKMLQSYTSDQGETVYNENYEYTYPVFSAEFTGTPSLSYVTDYVSNMRTEHPRLLTQDFSVYIERADNDYMSKRFYDSIISASNDYLNKAPYQFYMNIRDNINDYSGNIEQRIVTLAMAYNLEKTKKEMGRTDYVADYEKYADRAIEEMLNAAKYPHWSQDAYLCTAEISVGFAYGYDWLYDYLHQPKNAEALQIILDTIYEMSIVPYAYNYSKKSYWGTNNWNEVCNGSGMVTAIAFYDANDTTGKFSTLCQYVLEGAAHYMYKGLVQYQDGGFFREGIGYWSYATEYMTYAMAVYNSAAKEGYTLPNRFRHIEVQGVAQTPEFPIYMNGVTGTLNFGDCGSSLVYSEIMYWFASYLNKPEYAAYVNNFLLLHNKSFSNEAAVYSLIWYEPQNIDFNALSRLPLDKAHVSEDDVNILTMRSSFEANSSHRKNVFVGMQGGDYSAGHLGVSLGSFVLDMNGKRFVRTLGAGNYVWPGYFSTSNEDSQRYTYYCMRGEGNNVLIVDPGYGAEMKKNAFVPLIESGTSKNVAYGVMDLTSTSDKFARYHRGIMLTDNRRRVVVQDEIQATAEAGQFKDVYWHAHTGDPESGGAKVEISADGKSAYLTIGEQTIVAKITRGPGTFEWVDAEPMPTSPNPEIQQARMSKYGKKLRIHLTNVASAVIRVEFSPLGMETENVPYATIANWSTQLSDEEDIENYPTYLNTNNYETDWYKERYNTYYIHDDKDLAGVAYMVNNGVDFAGKTIKLVNDITMDPTLSWVPIGSDSVPFKGKFDGSQKTIDQLYYNNDTGKNVGLFGKTENASIKNLRMNNANVTADVDAGALVGTAMTTTITNVFVDRCQLRANMRVGGIVGTLSAGSIVNSGMSGKVFGHVMNYGGIAGYSTGVIENCSANPQLCEYTSTYTTETKTIIALNENTGNLEKTVVTTTRTVHNTTGQLISEKVTPSEPVVVTGVEVGEKVETETEKRGIAMGGNYGGVVGVSAYGDVRHSYYLYTRLYIPSGSKPYSTASVNKTNSCGKFTSNAYMTVSNIAAFDSVLEYTKKSTALTDVLGAWISAQPNPEEYLTWSKHTTDFGASPILKFVPEEVVDENNNRDLFEITDGAVENGNVNFKITSSRNQATTGYLVIVQTNQDGTVTTKLEAYTAANSTPVPYSLAANANVANVKVFVLESFMSMKIKSNVLTF